MLTEEERAIQEGFNQYLKVQKEYDCSVEDLTKKEKRFLYYKFACLNVHSNCDRIAKNKKLHDFKQCMLFCQYSYEYA